jgi:hypothetical protein
MGVRGVMASPRSKKIFSAAGSLPSAYAILAAKHKFSIFAFHCFCSLRMGEA